MDPNRLLPDSDVAEVFRRLAAADPRPATLPVKLQRDPFRSLVACMLSAQSPDARTDLAATALFRLARTPKALLALSEPDLIAAIKPAGLYNTKARNIRRMCTDLLARFGGRVPRTRDELTSLPGVGRKCADIVLRFVFDVPVVAVDTHVHRLCNRLGLARGKTEAQTASSLEPRVPERYRLDAHIWLIEHGKPVCTARAPRCGACLLADLCPSRRAAVDAAATA